MALERQSIEKKDFPIGRRGYDPEAVDAHLAAVAGEIEELRRSSRRRSETLASTASEQVRAIVEAAESSAAEIQRQAEDEAREIRAEASSEAHAAREQATAQAREYVSKVSESTAIMLQRLDAMESELGALVESLRTGSNRLNADLHLLETNLTEVRESVGPGSARFGFEPEPVAVAPAAVPPASAYAGASTTTLPAVEPLPPTPADEPEAAAPIVPAEPVGPPVFEPAVSEPPASPPVPSGSATEPAAPSLEEPTITGAYEDEDAEGARLIALNMALNGTPREETDRYLAENFELGNRKALLDEVYASVEG